MAQEGVVPCGVGDPSSFVEVEDLTGDSIGSMLALVFDPKPSIFFWYFSGPFNHSRRLTGQYADIKADIMSVLYRGESHFEAFRTYPDIFGSMIASRYFLMRPRGFEPPRDFSHQILR